MRKTEKKTLGERTYIVTQMGGVQGRKVLMRFLQVAGGALGALTGKGGKAQMQEGIKSLVEGLSEENTEYFFNAFTEGTQVQLDATHTVLLSNPGMFDDLFAGNYVEMMEWLVFSFQVNFGHFLDGGSALLAQMAQKTDLKKASQPSELPKESTQS